MRCDRTRPNARNGRLVVITLATELVFAARVAMATVARRQPRQPAPSEH